MTGHELGAQRAAVRWADLLHMAVRGVTRNRRRTVLNGFTVMLAVCALLFARSYLAGLKLLIENAVIEAGTGALRVQREGYAGSQELAPLNLDLPESGELEERIRRVPEVRAVSPRLRFSGLITANDQSTVFSGLAIVPSSEQEVCPQGPAGATDRLQGAPLESRASESVVLGAKLAAALKLKIGDVVTLLVQTRTGSTDAMDLTVRGIYSPSDPAAAKHLVVLSLDAAQKLLHMPKRVSDYGVAVKPGASVDETRNGVHDALSAQPEPIEVMRWSDLAPTLRELIELQERVLGLVVLLVALMGAVGITNIMLMAVSERVREIGTLMALGFRRFQLLLLFLAEAVFLGTGSAGVGALLGMGLVWATHVQGIPFDVPGMGEVLNRPLFAGSDALRAVLASFLGALVGGVYPAWRASRLEPVEALRTV